MRHVLATMGTVASIDGPAEAIPAIERCFDELEARFSLYRHDSELSRIARGEARMTDASESMRAVYARALEWRSRTGGAFSPNRPDGVIDLDGIVKAEAIAVAGSILDAAGRGAWTVNVGGDLLTDEPQRVGIADPQRPGTLLASIALDGAARAVATSGSAERGDHIWRGGSTEPPEFVQVTVVAADIVTADVLATAIVAGGRASLDDATERWAVDVLAVDRDGGLLATPGMRERLAALPLTPGL